MVKINKSASLLLVLLIAMSVVVMVKPATAQSASNPEITILYPTNGTFFNVSQGVDSFQLKYATNNALSWIGYSVDGGQNKTAYGEWYDFEQRLYYGTEGNPSVWVYDVFENDGNHNLTLYANNTTGEWATPQIVMYLVNINADTTVPPTTSTPTPTSPVSTINTGAHETEPFPTVLVIALITIVVVIASIMLLRRHPKSVSQETLTTLSQETYTNSFLSDMDQLY